MAALPPVGAFGLSRITGVLGMAVAAGQAFTFDGSRYTHAFLVLDADQVIEAMPSGARLAPLAPRVADPDVRWCDEPVQARLRSSRAALTDGGYEPDRIERLLATWESSLRAVIAADARELIGTPYSFADYLALTLAHLGVRADWLRARIERSGHLICSQLVDAVYARNDLHLFNDGRLPMDVTPGDLDAYRVSALEAGHA